MIIELNKGHLAGFAKKAGLITATAGAGTGLYVLGNKYADYSKHNAEIQDLKFELEQEGITKSNNKDKMEKQLFTIEQYEKQIKELNKNYRELLEERGQLINKHKQLEKNLSKANHKVHSVTSIVNKESNRGYHWANINELKRALNK